MKNRFFIIGVFMLLYTVSVGQIKYNIKLMSGVNLTYRISNGAGFEQIYPLKTTTLSYCGCIEGGIRYNILDDNKEVACGVGYSYQPMAFQFVPSNIPIPWGDRRDIIHNNYLYVPASIYFNISEKFVLNIGAKYKRFIFQEPKDDFFLTPYYILSKNSFDIMFGFGTRITENWSFMINTSAEIPGVLKTEGIHSIRSVFSNINTQISVEYTFGKKYE